MTSWRIYTRRICIQCKNLRKLVENAISGFKSTKITITRVENNYYFLDMMVGYGYRPFKNYYGWLWLGYITILTIITVNSYHGYNGYSVKIVRCDRKTYTRGSFFWCVRRRLHAFDLLRNRIFGALYFSPKFLITCQIVILVRFQMIQTSIFGAVSIIWLVFENVWLI